MKIDIICSDDCHPIYPFLLDWVSIKGETLAVELFQDSHDVVGGDILFLVSCSELIKLDVRNKYRKCFVIHASDLPKGRGWSPHVWQILEGKEKICVSLIEADDPVDSGKVWKKDFVYIAKDFDFEEICRELFLSEIRLLDYAVEAVEAGQCGEEQVGEATFYAKRTLEDSRLNIDKSVREQFDLLRIADPNRYPAFFDHLGYRYQLMMKKLGAIDEK